MSPVFFFVRWLIGEKVHLFIKPIGEKTMNKRKPEHSFLVILLLFYSCRLQQNVLSYFVAVLNYRRLFYEVCNFRVNNLILPHVLTTGVVDTGGAPWIANIVANFRNGANEMLIPYPIGSGSEFGFETPKKTCQKDSYCRRHWSSTINWFIGKKGKFYECGGETASSNP